MPFNKTDLKKMKKDELVALVMKQQEEKEREIVELKEELKDKDTTIHNIKKFWLEEDDENFSVAGAIVAMEDSVKDLDNAEGQNEIDKEEIEKLKDENERLKKHIINNYQDLDPNGEGVPHTEFFPGGRYAIDEEEEKRLADEFEKKFPGERSFVRTPYSALCGQIGEGISDLRSKVDDLEQHACSSLSLCCDCCQSSITEDDVNMSIEKRCGKLLCEECCDEQQQQEAEQQLESRVKELKKEIQDQKDRNDELEDYYCERQEKIEEDRDTWRRLFDGAIVERNAECQLRFKENDRMVEQVKKLSLACALANDELKKYKTEDSDKKEEEEGDSRCMTCEKRFCMYDAQKAEPEAYDKYFGSGDDDGDLCPQCLIKWQL